MKKRILSCLMALALCLTLLPTAAFAEEPEGTAQTSQAVEEAADPANGKAKQENQPTEQEEQQQEDSATKQDEAVAAVQALIDDLPDAAELDGMDDADAMEVYEAFQTACDAYYDTLTEEQQAQLKNTEKLAALSDWFSQPATLAAEGEHTDHCICGAEHKRIGDHSTEKNAFTDAKKLWMKDSTLMKGDSEWQTTKYEGKTYLPLEKGSYYLETDLTLNQYSILISGDVALCLNGKTIEMNGKADVIEVSCFESTKNISFTLTDCKDTGTITHAVGKTGGGVILKGTVNFTMYDGKITGNTTAFGGGVEVNDTASVFAMYGGEITNNTSNRTGGGVNVNGTFRMYGGTITGNTTKENGGGVYVLASSGSLRGGIITVSGAAKITGNKKGDRANNVYLPEGVFINLGDTLTGEIGVSTESVPTGDVNNPVCLNYAIKADYSNYVKSDQAGYTVQNKSGLLELTIDAHKHCLCGEKDCNGGDGHSTEKTDFIPWTDALANQQERGKTASNSLPSKTGNYYLTGDVTLSNTWTPADGTVLCLNGHSIKAAGSITAIYVNNAFTLCDCKGGKDAYGQITHTAGKTGSGVYMTGANSKFNMYGGSITNNTADNGGGVYMAGGQFTMNGGEISGNTTTTGNGGGVYVGGGTFTMNYSASVKDNTASGNTADQGNGGGVYVYSGTFTMNDTASVSGNKATNNKTTNTTYGGGVCVKSTNSTFTMNDKASITGNTATNGGGVDVSGGKFNMSGGSITRNIGNGVCVDDDKNAKFTVSGAAVIKDNTRENAASNVYLNGGAYITIGGALNGGKGSIGVTVGAGSVIAKNVSTDYSGCFFSDKTQYVVKHDNKQLVLKKAETQPSEHSHTYGKWSKDDTNHWRECTDMSCPNKAESIKDKAAHVYDNDADATCNVCGYVRTVTPGNIPVSGVALNTTTATLKVGKTTILTATVTPDNATDNRVTWTSSNENIATVDANGTVKALAAGTTAITATAADGSGKSATCTVTVTGGTTPSQPGGGSSGGGGSSSGGSSGGGGSSSPSNHPVKAEVSKDPDGSVSLSKTSAAKGDKVTITVKPERHYEVDEVIVRDSKGKQLAVKDNGDGTFTFEMPADKVTVEPSFSWVNPFADVADSAYYVDAVEWMLKREVTQGTTETTFSPDLNCTRAQIVTFLWRVAGSPEAKGTVSFADVSADSYYAKAVAWATENGITDGIGGGLFSPDATCTRAQSAVFLYRVAGSPAVNGSAGFSDVAADAYYAQAVAWAKEHGITDGIGGGLFGSANDCTRAQIAAFLYRYMK